jgi:hypothetical protein
MASARNPVAVAALSLAIVAAACSDSPVAPGLPQGPTSPAAPSPSPQPPPVRTSAALAIEDPSVIVTRSRTDNRGVAVEDGWFSLEVRFALRETGGTSGATVESYRIPGEIYGGICTVGLRVPPGGVFDTLYTDEGYASWSYCAPYLGVVSAPVTAYPVLVTVTFVDDDGRQGSVSAEAVWKKQ